jgi:hypothetical protein
LTETAKQTLIARLQPILTAAAHQKCSKYYPDIIAFSCPLNIQGVAITELRNEKQLAKPNINAQGIVKQTQSRPARFNI